jgi:probable rRNA maturation factor
VSPAPAPSTRPAPSIRIAVGIEKSGWNRALPDAAKIGRQAARRALKAALASGLARGPRLARQKTLQLSLVLENDAAVRNLNRDFRGKDKPTNVLSFAALDDAPLEKTRKGARLPTDTPIYLGDIILALETLKSEAKAQRKSLRQHYTHLVVHGVLHLLGFDHMRASDARRMEDLERVVLAGLGWPDPYVS